MLHDDAPASDERSFGWALGTLMSRIEHALYDALWHGDDLLATPAPAAELIGLLEDAALLYLDRYGLKRDALPAEITRDWTLRKMERARESAPRSDVNGPIAESMFKVLYACALYRSAASAGAAEHAVVLAMNALWAWRTVIPTLEEYDVDELAYHAKRVASKSGGRAKGRGYNHRRRWLLVEFDREIKAHQRKRLPDAPDLKPIEIARVVVTRWNQEKGLKPDDRRYLKPATAARVVRDAVRALSRMDEASEAD